MVHKRIVAHKRFPQVDRFFLYAMMKASLYFSQQKSYPVFFLLTEFKPFPDRKLIIKLLKYDNLFPPLRHSS